MELTRNFMRENDLSRLQNEVSLYREHRAKLQRQEKNAAIVDLRNVTDQIHAPSHPKSFAFSNKVLIEKNPDWALLNVKSAMQQDEDKPMYSCFSPDGYFREMMLPQIRSDPGNTRQIPQELRGMVRVL